MRVKNTNISNKAKEGKKDQRPFLALKAAFSWKQKEFPNALIKELREKLEEWCERPGIFYLRDFFNEFGIAESSFYVCVNKDEELAALLKEAMSRIGHNREKLLFERDPSQVRSTMHLYARDWRKTVDEERDFKRSISKDINTNDKIVVVLKDPEVAKEG